MTILMYDAYKLLGVDSQTAVSEGRLYDILYADDTLVLGTTCAETEELARAIEIVGSRYGLNIHWGKTQAISLGSSRPLQQPDGTPIEDANSLIYLGGQLDKDGRVESELSQENWSGMWRVPIVAKTLGTLRHQPQRQTCLLPCFRGVKAVIWSEYMLALQGPAEAD